MLRYVAGVMWLRLTQDLKPSKPHLKGNEMSKIDHVARARAAWKPLYKLARKGGCISYGALTKPLGLHHRSARWFLGVIQEECRRQNFPPLQAIVVNKQTGAPGAGYVATGRQGKTYRKAVQRVHKYRWPKKAPF